MSIGPDDMQSIALELSESSNEAKVRASIGRSYYSAYHHGLRHLGVTDIKEVVGGSGGVHKRLSDLLEDSNMKPAAYVLADLKAKRVLADYDLSYNFAQEDAKAAIDTFNRFIEKLK